MKKKYMKVRVKFPQIYKIQTDRYEYFVVSARSRKLGLNIRRQFNTLQQALSFARELENQILEKGKRVSENVVYTNPEIEKLIDRLKPWGKTLKDSVDYFIPSLELELKQSLIPPIKELCEKWYFQKKNSTLNPLKTKTLNELKSYHTFINRHWGQLKPSQVTKDGIETILTESYGQNITKKQRLTYIRMFFKWCVVNKYISTNPTEGIPVTVPKKEVEIWEPEKISQLLTVVEEKYPELLGYYVLCVFGGLRPSESQRVEWKDINFEGKEIYVNPKGKTGSRRFVLEKTPNGDTDTLWVWLEHFREIQPDGTFNPLRNHENLQKKVRGQVSFNWEQDVLRHSFGTYYYNLIHDLGKVVFVMGNSEQICKRHYVREVKKSSMVEFWKLRPQVKSPSVDRNLTEENVSFLSQPIPVLTETLVNVGGRSGTPGGI